MSGTVTVPMGHDVRIPLTWKDDAGVVTVPVSGTTAESDNRAVVDAVDVAADQLSIVCRVVGQGSANIIVSNDTMTDTVQVVVAMPAASSVNIDSTDKQWVLKGAAP